MCGFLAVMDDMSDEQLVRFRLSQQGDSVMNDDDTITELRAGLVAAFGEVFDLKVRVADLQACNARQAEGIAQAATSLRTALQEGMPPNTGGET